MQKVDESYINWLRNKIESNEWHNSAEGYNPKRTFAYLINILDDPKVQTEAYLCESLLTGMIAEDKILVLRCFKQACQNISRLASLNCSTIPYTDYLSVLQLRIENALKETKK